MLVLEMIDSVHITYIYQYQAHIPPPPTQKTYLKRVILHPRIRFAVVGRIGVRIVAEDGQHGRNFGHIVDDVLGYLADPLGQRLQVHRLDDLIG